MKTALKNQFGFDSQDACLDYYVRGAYDQFIANYYQGCKSYGF
ncbi:hypothetical protein [Clostridium chromiireducens]|nr:hypothetical protein [Clostridium chromiireducens]